MTRDGACVAQMSLKCISPPDGEIQEVPGPTREGTETETRGLLDINKGLIEERELEFAGSTTHPGVWCAGPAK